MPRSPFSFRSSPIGYPESEQRTLAGLVESLWYIDKTLNRQIWESTSLKASRVTLDKEWDLRIPIPERTNWQDLNNYLYNPMYLNKYSRSTDTLHKSTLSTRRKLQTLNKRCFNTHRHIMTQKRSSFKNPAKTNTPVFNLVQHRVNNHLVGWHESVSTTT